MARNKKEDMTITDVKENNVLFDFFKESLNSQDIADVETFISTGSTLLDYAIANKKNGGIPLGRISEISGDEATGKSLITYHILANVQKAGGVGVYIDTERAANKEFMVRMGVNWDKLIYTKKPACIEEVFEYVENVIKTTRLKIPNKNIPVLIVWDSVAGTPPKSELEGAYDEQSIGVAARVMSKSLRKISDSIDGGNVALVCINQLRTKIGIAFGDPNITPHGKALPFYSSVRVRLSTGKKIMDKNAERVIGVECNAKVVKNKVAPNWRTIQFPLVYDWGVDDENSWLTHLAAKEIISSSGAWKTLKMGDKEERFQSSGWSELLKNPDIRKFVLDKLEETMIIKFEQRPSVDIESDAIVNEEE